MRILLHQRPAESFGQLFLRDPFLFLLARDSGFYSGFLTQENKTWPVVLAKVIFSGSLSLMKISFTGTQIMSSLLLTPVSLLIRRFSTKAVISVSYITLRPIARNVCSTLFLILIHTNPFVLLYPTSVISFNGNNPVGRLMRVRSSLALSRQRDGSL